MPMNRSRVFTTHATTSEKVANRAEPRNTPAVIPTSPAGSVRTRTPITSAMATTMTPCTSPRAPAAIALPTTSEEREAGETSSLCTIPRSRSQMTAMP